MSVWQSFDKEKRAEYIRFLQIYGALSNLFRQKQGDPIPYLDSKFQETIFSLVFQAENVDKGNTPHDILSIINQKRIGIGLKTWMHSKPSYQKVMQIKSYQKEINEYKNNSMDLAYKISEIKNARMLQDYARLDLKEENNIYHYITRDHSKFVINECTYPLVNLNSIQNIICAENAISWEDGVKKYKYNIWRLSNLAVF